MDYDTQRMEEFFKWFITLEGNIYDKYSLHIMDKFIREKPKVSSLKIRAEEIKNRFNHKFNNNGE